MTTVSGGRCRPGWVAGRGPPHLWEGSFSSAHVSTRSGVEGASPGPETPLPAGSTRNSDPRPLLWAVLLLVAVALVLGVSVFMGLSQAKAQRLQEGSRV